MKHLISILTAFVVCVTFASCGDPTSKIKSLAEDVSNNGSSWTEPDQWESFIMDAIDACCEFGESEFSEEELDDFVNACIDLAKDLQEVTEERDVKKALRKAGKSIGDDEDLEDRVRSAFKKATERAEELEYDLSDAFRTLRHLDL